MSVFTSASITDIATVVMGRREGAEPPLVKGRG